MENWRLFILISKLGIKCIYLKLKTNKYDDKNPFLTIYMTGIKYEPKGNKSHYIIVYNVYCILYIMCNNIIFTFDNFL